MFKFISEIMLEYREAGKINPINKVRETFGISS